MALVVLYDANVLYPNTLRDVLIRVAMGARWTDEILAEVFSRLKENRPDLDARARPHQSVDERRGPGRPCGGLRVADLPA